MWRDSQLEAKAMRDKRILCNNKVLNKEINLKMSLELVELNTKKAFKSSSFQDSCQISNKFGSYKDIGKDIGQVHFDKLEETRSDSLGLSDQELSDRMEKDYSVKNPREGKVCGSKSCCY